MKADHPGDSFSFGNTGPDTCEVSVVDTHRLQAQSTQLTQTA